MRRRSSGRGALLGVVVGLVLLCGCQPPTEIELTPGERSELIRRSEDLLLRAAESEYDDVRVHALEALVEVAPRLALPQFRGATEHEKAVVRYAGLVSLGRLGDAESLPWVRARLNDPDPHVRLAAAFAALRCGVEDERGRCAWTLATALSSDPSPDLRADAAYLIGQLGEQRAIRRLRRAVRYDESQKVRVQAIGALAMLEAPGALQELVRYTDGDQVGRLVALQALVEIADPNTADALRGRLYGAQDDEYLVIRLIAARGLGRMGSDEGYDLAVYVLKSADRLTSRLDDDTERLNERIKLETNAALALGAIGQTRAIPLLRELAESGDPPVQVAACYAIVQVLEARDEQTAPAALHSPRGAVFSSSAASGG